MRRELLLGLGLLAKRLLAGLPSGGPVLLLGLWRCWRGAVIEAVLASNRLAARLRYGVGGSSKPAPQSVQAALLEAQNFSGRNHVVHRDVVLVGGDGLGA